MGKQSSPPMDLPPLDDLRECLMDTEQPIGKRTHAAFFLRTLDTAAAVDVVCQALLNKSDSALLRHELAYILGQMQNPLACVSLEGVLGDTDDDCMVRHEAAEALGAIGQERSYPVLKLYAEDSAPEVSQTCQLALDLMEWRGQQHTQAAAAGAAAGGVPEASDATKKSTTDISSGSDVMDGIKDVNPYQSVDPAPSALVGEGVSTEELGSRLRDQGSSLFRRYRAMFSLRNRGGEAAALQLSAAFDGEDNALFKHEVAYVLGQMQHPAAVSALGKVLADTAQHRMVRHEAAEALGAIGGEESERLLEEFRADEVAVVAESCDVALETVAFWLESEPQNT